MLKLGTLDIAPGPLAPIRLRLW